MVNKDYSISLIRLLAMICIIICHMFQYHNNVLSGWFNIGVQLFLCISGFLYGKRQLPNDVRTYIVNRFFRIYIDYFLLIMPIIALYFIFHPSYITNVLALKMLIAFQRVPGGGHLWYVPYILLCSLLCIFYWLIHADIQGYVRLLKVLLITFLIQVLIMETFFSYFNSAWINCYYLGFVIGIIVKKKELRAYNVIKRSIAFVAIVLNLIQITIDFIVTDFVFTGFALGCYHRFCNYAHVFLGISLFLVLHDVFYNFDFIKGKHFRNFFEMSDKYSYDIYLVHQFLILGPFSLMSFTSSFTMNIIIILILICFFAFLLNKASQFALKLLTT